MNVSLTFWKTRCLPWRPWLPSPNRDDELVIGMEPTVDRYCQSDRKGKLMAKIKHNISGSNMSLGLLLVS